MFLNDDDWDVLVEVERKTRGRINKDLWNKYWNVVERFAVRRDNRKYNDYIYTMLREFDYKKNGKELSIQFLITMLCYLNGLDD